MTLAVALTFVVAAEARAVAKVAASGELAGGEPAAYHMRLDQRIVTHIRCLSRAPLKGC